ncbi:MAG: nitroreductase family protein [Sphingobium sp.]
METVSEPDIEPAARAAAAVFAYHRRTAHRADGYARGPETLDWDAQPDPWRIWRGCDRLDLPLVSDALDAPYAVLTGEASVAPAPFGVPSVAALLELSFGLSAWKEAGPDRWALRCNPSSGNLHPTEAYVLASGVPGLADGVHHYDSRGHALEQRCAVDFAGGRFWIGLSSVLWREAWKYGERAFRYCQLDIGHAVGALQAAAALLGWRVTVPGRLESSVIAGLIGTDRAGDFAGAEREEAELLLAVDLARPGDAAAQAPVPGPSAQWHGAASLLDPHPMYRWPVIDEVAAATRGLGTGEELPLARPAPVLPPPPAAAVTTILTRRSAQRYDRTYAMPLGSFARIIDAVRPQAGSGLHLIAFVHAVDGIERGIYAVPRPGAAGELERALDPGFAWAQVTGVPRAVPLRRLVTADCRKLVRARTCHQAITADGCVTFCLLSDFAPLVEPNPWAYRAQHWQAGLLGHRLYLEAQAAGLAGTGIGCFLDDEIHRLLGIRDERLRALYHFTIGQALFDARIATGPAYGERGRAEAPVWP